MQKRDVRYYGNDFNAMGISDSLVGMGEVSLFVVRKLFPKAKPLENFNGG
jgi:hypothetical protein